MILVQKPQNNRQKSSDIRHTNATKLKRVCISMKKSAGFKWDYYEPEISLYMVR